MRCQPTPDVGTNHCEAYHKEVNKKHRVGGKVVTPDMDDMRTEMGRLGFNHGKLLRALKGNPTLMALLSADLVVTLGSSRARRYTGGKNSHKWQLLLEEILDSLLAIWTTPMQGQSVCAISLPYDFSLHGRPLCNAAGQAVGGNSMP